jgi:hypothetical protein
MLLFGLDIRDYWLSTLKAQEIFLCLKASRQAFGTHTTSYPFGIEDCYSGTEAANLVLRIRMNGSIPPLLYMPACRAHG